MQLQRRLSLKFCKMFRIMLLCVVEIQADMDVGDGGRHQLARAPPPKIRENISVVIVM